MKNLNYFEAVSDLAQYILDDALTGAHTEGEIYEALQELSAEISDRVHEYVDGNSWTIYTAKQVEIYLRSSNFPEDMDEYGYYETFSDLLSSGSYAAMHADVMSELSDLIQVEFDNL